MLLLSTLPQHSGLHDAGILTQENFNAVTGCRNIEKLQELLISPPYQTILPALRPQGILALVAIVDNDVSKMDQAIKKAEPVKNIVLPSTSQAFNNAHLYILALRLYEKVNQKLDFLSIHREGHLIAIASLRDAASHQENVPAAIETFRANYPGLQQYLPNSASNTSAMGVGNETSPQRASRA